MGTNRPGEIRLLAETARPDGAIVTSVYASHLEMLGSVEGVAREKASLIESLPEDGFAVLNADNPHVAEMAARTRAHVVRISVEGPGDLVASDVKFNCLGTTFLLDGRLRVTIPRLGTHNVTNTLCALAAAQQLGMSLEDAVQGLHGLPPTDRRFEPRRCGPVVVYDDSYNMNPGSARAALLAFAGLAGAGRKIVVFGDMLELGEQSDALHYEVGRELGTLGFDHFVAAGQRARMMADGAIAAGLPGARITTTLDRESATQVLLGILGEGDRILVKASRRMEMDRLVERIAAHFGQQGRGGPLPGVEVCA
jgi:UDP-N-acetylmuramyl pentapeptide synthase